MSENQSEQMQNVNVLKKQKSEKENKLKSCKIRYGMGDIDDEIYSMTIEALQKDMCMLLVVCCREDITHGV